MSKIKHIRKNLFLITLLTAKVGSVAIPDGQGSPTSGQALTVDTLTAAPQLPEVSPLSAVLVEQVAVPSIDASTPKSASAGENLAAPTSPMAAEEGLNSPRTAPSIATSAFSNPAELGGGPFDGEADPITDFAVWPLCPTGELPTIPKSVCNWESNTPMSRLYGLLRRIPGFRLSNSDPSKDLNRMLKCCWTGAPLVIKNGSLVDWDPSEDPSTANIYAVTLTGKFNRRRKLVAHPISTSLDAQKSIMPQKQAIEDRKVIAGETLYPELVLARLAQLALDNGSSILDQVVDRKLVVTAQRDLLVIKDDLSTIDFVILPSGDRINLKTNISKDRATYTWDSSALKKAGVTEADMQTERLIKFAKNEGQGYCILTKVGKPKSEVYHLFQSRGGEKRLVCYDVFPTKMTTWSDPYSILAGLVGLRDPKDKWVNVSQLDGLCRVNILSLDSINNIIGANGLPIQEVKDRLLTVLEAYRTTEVQGPKSVQFA